MATVEGNTALMRATSPSGLVDARVPALSHSCPSEVIAHDERSVYNEKMYQATMAMVRRMHSDGLISPEEYAKVERIFLKKYKPLIGTVYAEMALTPCPSWGIYGEG